MVPIGQQIPGSAARRRVARRRLRIAFRKLQVTGWTLWLALGSAAVAATMLGELSQLLADITSKGEVSYSADAFTAFTFAPAEAGHELADAFALWCPGEGTCRLEYVSYYVLIDALLFAPSLAYLLYWVMCRIGLRSQAKWTVAGLLLVDVLESVSTGALVCFWPEDELWFVLSRTLSSVKWIVFAAAAVITLGGWASRDIPGVVSRQRKQAGSHLRIAAKLAGPITALTLFLTLVALPGDGPLDQLPDVLRNQLSELLEQGNPRPFVGSVFGLLLFFLALLVGTFWATYRPGHGPYDAPRTQRLLDGTLIVGLVVFTGEGLLGVPRPWIGFVPFALIGVLALLDRVVRRVKEHAADPGHPTEPAPPAGTPPRISALASTWVPILPALAVTGSGIGLLRAAFKPWVLGLHPQWPWFVGTAVAVVVAVFLGALTQRACRWMLKQRRPGRMWIWRVPEVGGAVVLALCALWLALDPQAAVNLTFGGTIAVCLGLIALLVGGLHYASQRSKPWDVTVALRLGRLRTPWVGLAVATWLIAYLLSGTGGYHDIRAYPDGPAATYADPAAAFRSWLRVVAQDGRCVEQIESPSPRQQQSVVRMIMVAAPGGGIRASYWTASGLDAMTSSAACGARNVAAISGVSGGSVGSAAWLAAPGGSARDTVRSLASDHALAASTASLFLRDMVQPFFGAGTLWRDRSAVMEDAWTSQAGSAFGTVQSPVRFSGLGAQLGWQPVVMFNGSSVTDGCRVLVTNVARLPAGPSPCELTAAGGALPGSLDALADLSTDMGREGTSCSVTGRGDMPLLTAALMSARFPVISSSGVFDRCVASRPGSADQPRRVRTTYDVDGGYYENSGLLSLLQFWEAIRPIVQTCNALVTAPEAGRAVEQCPNVAAQVKIEPWIVVLDNHYESPAAAAPVPRQDELTLPVQALMNSSDVVGQANLEETARIAMQNFLLQPGDTAATTITGQFARIGPSKRPTVEAPLGWVLSRTARCGLEDQLMDYAPPSAVLDHGLVGLSEDCQPTINQGPQPGTTSDLSAPVESSAG